MRMSDVIRTIINLDATVSMTSLIEKTKNTIN